MSLLAGSVSVNPDATFTGTGLAIGLMNAEIAQFDPRTMHCSDAAKLAAVQGLAAKVDAYASAITTWLAAGGYT